MGFKLKSNHQNMPLVDTNISSSTNTDSVCIGGFEGPFSIQVIWENGAALDVDISLEVSNDNTHWAPYSGSTQNITAAAASHMYDISESGVEFIRVVLTVNAGSADFTIKFNGKSRV